MLQNNTDIFGFTLIRIQESHFFDEPRLSAS